MASLTPVINLFLLEAFIFLIILQYITNITLFQEALGSSQVCCIEFCFPVGVPRTIWKHLYPLYEHFLCQSRTWQHGVSCLSFCRPHEYTQRCFKMPNLQRDSPKSLWPWLYLHLQTYKTERNSTCLRFKQQCPSVGITLTVRSTSCLHTLPLQVA